MTVDKSQRRVRAMFGQIARRYDFLNHVLSAGVDVHWRAQTARAVDPSGSGPILDVCTGTGDLAIALRKRLGPARRIIGTDFTHEMLVLARRKIERLPNSNISVLEADAQALPFAENQFAAVTVAFGLRNVTDTKQGLREMVRVCQPEGEVVVLEFSQPEAPVLGGMYRWYFRNVLPRVGQMLARNRHSAYEYLPESVGEFPSGRALVAVMEECGLTDVSYTPLTFGVATLYRGRKTVSPSGSADASKFGNRGSGTKFPNVADEGAIASPSPIPDSRFPTSDSRTPEVSP